MLSCQSHKEKFCNGLKRSQVEIEIINCVHIVDIHVVEDFYFFTFYFMYGNKYTLLSILFGNFSQISLAIDHKGEEHS